jgi:hypothetical protein
MPVQGLFYLDKIRLKTTVIFGTIKINNVIYKFRA